MHRTRRLLRVVVVAFLVTAACSSANDGAASTTTERGRGTTATTEPAPSGGCDTGPPASTGASDRTMTSGGEERSFQVIVPNSYDGTTPLPVVIGIHGLSVDYRFVPGLSGFDDMAEAYDFIGVSPSGMLDGNVPYWIAAPVEPNRDVTYISDLLDRLEAELCVDTSRVYATGMSNGGQMSSVLACQLDERITAVAPLAGVEWPASCDGEPVPVMAFHGDADPIVTYEGGGLNATAIANLHSWKGNPPDGLPVHGGVDEAMSNWAEHNGCEAEPTVEEITDEVARYAWEGCDADTVLYRIVGGGHTWPNKPMPAFEQMFGHTTTDIDATNLMFEFFLGPAED